MAKKLNIVVVVLVVVLHLVVILLIIIINQPLPTLALPWSIG